MKKIPYKLVIDRTLKHMAGQIIGIDGKVMAVADSRSQNFSTAPKTKIQQAEEVGKMLAQKLLKQKINQVWFDRQGQKYHGRIKALIEAMRKQGVKV